MDSNDKQDVLVFDLTGPYLIAKNDDFMHMIMCGKIYELMVLTELEVY